MVSNDLNINLKEDREKKICPICNKEIDEDDLIYILGKAEGELPVHFKCYIEIQDKICSECGVPFIDREELLFCEEHKEYFHSSNPCLKKHMNKHMPFRKAHYNAQNVRIIFDDE